MIDQHQEKEAIEKRRREREGTVFVRDKDMEEEESETRSVRADDLLESPFKGSFAANGRVRIAFDG